MTMPSPDTPAQMPIALARSRPTKVLVRIDSVVGKMSAPPMPMSPRAAINIPGDVANDANAENVANRTRPAVSAFLRPSRSPSDPAVSSSPAKTIVYASMIHCSCDPFAPRSLHDRRQRDVEDGVVDADDDQRQAQHAERPPAPLVHPVRERRGHRPSRGSVRERFEQRAGLVHRLFEPSSRRASRTRPRPSAIRLDARVDARQPSRRR